MSRTRIVRHERGRAPRAEMDSVVAEEPLEIRVDSRPVAVVMRTPGHDEELAVGFLVSEGLVTSQAQVRAVRPNLRNRSGNSVDVLLAPEVCLDFSRLTRHVFASSSCGLCGTASIAAVRRQFPAPRSVLRLGPDQLLALPAALRSAQTVFASTGGLHAAALIQPDGTLGPVREDVGRHNAVDKLLGRALLDGRLPLSGMGLMVSGRVSFEIVQKALAGGLGLIAAVSAPTRLAVEFARRNGQTLVGFLRENRFNVYAGRVKD